MEHDIVINEDGTIQFVYSDELAAVFDGEEQTTKRASHVEPFRDGWVADMTPSGGGYLWMEGETFPLTPLADLERGLAGALLVTPFKTRAEALAAEREWLRKEKGL